MNKTCKKCFFIKSLEEFPNNKTTKDGKYSYCRSCKSQNDKISYKKHKVYIKKEHITRTNGILLKHSIDSANKILKERSLTFLTITSINDDYITIKDNEFGEYATNLKNISPSMKIPLHKKRRHIEKIKEKKEQFLGKRIGRAKVDDLFYGPDRGYKNRSFYCKYINECGHEGISTLTWLNKYKKTIECFSCTKTIHGERTKENGVLKKRTPTYIAWVSHKKNLPIEYHNFEYFRLHVGDKPSKKATIVLINNKPEWNIISIDLENDELNTIAMAIRQAFRRSNLYKQCLQTAQVETEFGTRYKCANCKEIFRFKDIQVDHIEPITRLDGKPLDKETLIDRIWTDKIQVLDKKCHIQKSKQENSYRRETKKNMKLKQQVN